MNEFFFICQFFIFCYIVDGNNDLSQSKMNDKIAAIHKFLDNQSYNNLVPPIGVNNTVEIDLKFEIVKIASVETSKGKISILGSIVLGWQDHRLIWNLTNNSNNFCIKRRASTLWFPQLLLINGMESNLELRPSTGGSQESVLTVHADGKVFWSRSSMFTVTCNMDVQRFPKDRQKCKLIISPSLEDYQTVRLRPSSDRNMLARFVNSTDWILLNGSLSNNKTSIVMGVDEAVVEQIFITIEVCRAEETYLIMMVIPIILLTFLLFVPYMLPPQLGPQKVIMPISIFVSFNIFMLMLERIMPKSRHPPAIGFVFVGMMGLCTFVAFMECLTVKFWYNPGNKRVSKLTAGVYKRILLPLFSCDFSKRYHRHTYVIPRRNRGKSLEGDAASLPQDLKLDPDCEEEDQITVKEFWEDMARINDRIGTVITAIMVIAITLKETTDFNITTWG